MFIDELLLLIA